jgi:hypothetical protein
MVKKFKRHPRFSKGTLKVSLLNPETGVLVEKAMGPDTILEGDMWENLTTLEGGMMLVPYVEPVRGPAKPRPAGAAPAPKKPDMQAQKLPQSVADKMADGFARMHKDASDRLPEPEPERAREGDGTYKGDDPATATNEAWEGGKAPDREKAPAKKKTKKRAPAKK